MAKPGILIVAALSVAVGASCNRAQSLGPDESPMIPLEEGEVVQIAGPGLACTGDAALADEMAQIINEVRGVGNKEILDRNGRLDTAAQDHACDMAMTGQASVAGSDGSNIVDRARAVNFPTCGVTQLVAMGGTPQGVVRNWLISAPHREQVLGQSNDDIGVGVTRGADGRLWWSVVLGDDCR